VRRSYKKKEAEAEDLFPAFELMQQTKCRCSSDYSSDMGWGA
jgi:hypothetical protein